jgi:hypothetical protein
MRLWPVVPGWSAAYRRAALGGAWSDAQGTAVAPGTAELTGAPGSVNPQGAARYPTRRRAPGAVIEGVMDCSGDQEQSV